MNKVYPFTTVQLLTDDIYVSYGGVTGTSTAFQRQAGYFVAEEWMSLAIGSPIVSAVITGTYFYPQHGSSFQLDWMYLQDIHKIQLLDVSGYAYYTIDGVDNYYAAIRNQERSILDIFQIIGNCIGWGSFMAPYQIRVVYEVGIPATITSSPTFRMALVELAEIVINELLGYGNEGVGDVGIEYFKNQDYAEKRTALAATVFGKSAKAQWIMRLVNSMRKRSGFSL